MDLWIVGVLVCLSFIAFLALAFSTMKDQLIAHQNQMAERMMRARPQAMELDSLTVDHRPLPGYHRRNLFGNFQARRLEQQGSDRVAFLFDGKVKVGGLISLVVGVFILGPLGTLPWEEAVLATSWFLFFHAGIGLVFLLSGLYVLFNGGSIRFDRAEGRMTVRRLMGPKKLDLMTIRGLQLISGGWHTADNDDYETFQLNLLLDSGHPPRQNLIEHADLNQLREDANRLAQFLAVPLLDQITTASAS